MRTCMCAKKAICNDSIVCPECWKAVPENLKDGWYLATRRVDRLVAARKILIWIRDNRRES